MYENKKFQLYTLFLKQLFFSFSVEPLVKGQAIAWSRDLP